MAGADTALPELSERVAAWLQRRPALLERQAQRGGGYGTVGATMPRWDFAGPPAGGPAAAAAAAAVGGDGAAGTPGAAAAPPAAQDFGTVVRRHTDAGTPGYAGGPQLGGTVQVRPATAAAGLGGVPPPSRLVIPSDPTQPDWPASAVGRPHSAAPPSAMAALPGSGEGSASRQLLQAGLQAASAGPGATPAVAAAADTAVAALGQLEAARPGAVRDALTELLTQLSLGNSPALAGLKGSAEALFGGGEGGGGGQAGGDGMPDLGPLGRFLMQRWRESVARERVQTSQQWPAS